MSRSRDDCGEGGAAPPDRPAGDADASGARRLASRRIYTGRVLNLDLDTVELPNRTVAELEMIRHPGAAAVLPVVGEIRTGSDPAILLIRQYRYAAGGFVLEVPAGRLDPGELPWECARRELLEETGCTAGRLTRLHGFFTTPGFTNEFIHVFLATGLERGVARHERDEVIRVEEHRLSEALAMVREGRIADGKTLVALLYAAAFLFSLPGGPEQA